MRWALRAGVLLLAAATWLFTPMTARSVALPDLTATKSDDVGGATTLNTSWTWTIRIANVGGASADFPDGSAIFIDEPPNDFRLTYGEFKVVSASGVTGSVLCGPTSSGPLECFADHGPVSITAGGFLDVAFLAAPTAPYLFGSFTNPRGGGGRCGVDPGNKVVESDESNNACNNETVTIFASDLTISKTDDVGGATTLGNGWTWTVHVANSGNAPATFADGRRVLVDDLPNVNIAYGSPAVANGAGLTGLLGCSIDATSELTCGASGGSFTVAVGGSFDVAFSALPSASGAFENPRPGGFCLVDPDHATGGVTSDAACDRFVSVGVPDLTATKTNTAFGVDLLGHQWFWDIRVSNRGNGPATFADGQLMLLDNLPVTGLDYGPIRVSPLFVSGTVACAVSSTSDLTCNASGGPVKIAAGGSFDVIFTTNPTSLGTFANPRSGGACMADPNNVVLESDESNNTCSDSVRVFDNTTTSVACTPTTVTFGDTTTCAATVTDTVMEATGPTGTVSFLHSGLGTFSPSMCTLVPTGAIGQAACSTSYQPQTTGQIFIAAGYSGDATHNASGNSTSITVPNLPPTVSAGGPYTVNEGGSIVVAASGSDPEGGPLTFAWDLDNDGTFETPGQSVTLSAAGRDGPSVSTIRVRVTDDGGLSATAQTTVNVLNVAPSVGPITGPVAPVQLNTSVAAVASFTDPGMLDTHTAVWDWGDGSASPGVVSETSGSGSVGGSHSYTAAGLYAVTLTVTDKDGASDLSVFQFVVVFDPSIGYVTGAGSLDSPAGAYPAAPALTGRATFSFMARYPRGATVPSGETDFRLQLPNVEFHFHSSQYQWLVVSNSRAQYTGTGTINGADAFQFVLTAIDGDGPGGGGVDKLRIKITDSGGTVVYDDQVGAPDTADPSTAIRSGNIVLHE